jgi:type III secretion protein V
MFEKVLAPFHRLVMVATHRSDVVLAIMLIAIVFMMVLRLPTALVDVLIAINMGVSALLLIVAMYLPSPLAFSSFPSVLLITTLFRLSLSIATTRLILLQADAGHIVQVFGDFVVGGNIVVGLVVFLILAIVQFIVITKGAERVAEVAARFSLDGMPGKQMSIDGDMRAGSIDMNEARLRRGNVEKESQLYGAMDGAMKFVKGDAIASLIIVFVNLIGGLIIGTMQKDMSAGDALHVYGVLTIGDGLVSQIPSLLISITAGIIVTRVTSADGSVSNVGNDIVGQITAQPKAILMASAMFLGFAFVPGMPATVFVLLAVGGVTVGLVLLLPPTQFEKITGKVSSSSVPAMSPSAGAARKKISDSADQYLPTVPLLMDVAEDLSPVFNANLLNEKLLVVRRGLFFELGVPFPGIHLRYNNTLPSETYTLLLHEVPVTQGRMRPNYLFARETEENLKALGVNYERDKNFLPNVPTLWVHERDRQRLVAAGAPYMEPIQILIHHVAVVLKRYAHEYIGIQETRFLLSRMEQHFPDLVKEVQRVLQPNKIAELLQRLVSEGVSIRNLRAISEAMVEWGQKEKDTVLLAEHIRIALKRQISYKFSSGQNVLPAHLLAPDVEDTIRNAVRQTSAGSYLALDPAVSRELVSRIKHAVGDLSRLRQIPVLLTSMDIRRYLRKLIEPELFDLPVVSYQELAQEINVQPLSRIDID